MTSPVSICLVVPDTRVLTSLGQRDLLHLLLSFQSNVELVVTDIVEYEAKRCLDVMVVDRISRFFAGHRDHIRIDPTAFSDLIERSKRDSTIELPLEASDMTIYAYLNNIFHRYPGVPMLVLLEDDWFMRNEVRPTNASLISLSAFFRML